MSSWSTNALARIKAWGVAQMPFRIELQTCSMLGGSWVVISAAISPPNMGYNYSYPTYNPTYNYP